MKIKQVLYESVFWRSLSYITIFLVNLVIAKGLGPALSGDLFYLINNLSFFVLLASFGLEAGIIHFVSKRSFNDKRIPIVILAWIFFISLVAVGIYSFFLKETLSFSSFYLKVCCFFFVAGTLLNSFFSAFLYGNDNYKTSNIIVIIVNLILLLLMPWRSLSSEPGSIVFFFIATLVQGISITIISYLTIFKEYKFNVQSLKVIIPAIRFSLLAFLGNIVFFLLYRVDYWIVEYYCGLASLGLYVQVSKIVQALLLLPMLLHSVVFQQISKDTAAIDIRLFGKIISAFIIIYSSITILLYFFGKQVIAVVWSDNYVGVFMPLLKAMPGVLFLAVSNIYSAIFSGTGYVKYNLYIALVTFVVVLAFDFLLIPIYGIDGASIASSISFFVMMLSNIVLLKYKNASLKVKKEFV